jgi:hypothetical protein
MKHGVDCMITKNTIFALAGLLLITAPNPAHAEPEPEGLCPNGNSDHYVCEKQSPFLSYADNDFGFTTP